MAVKSDQARWDRCIRSKLALRRSLEHGPWPLVGQCPFGVMERAYPVLAHGHAVGAVSVTSLKGDPERVHARLSRAGRTGGADAAALWVAYQRELYEYDAAMAEAECAAETLALTLSALSEHSRLPGGAQSAPQRQHGLVDRAMEYLYSQAGSPVRAADVAAFCHVSESYLQHLFAHQRGQSMVKTLAAIRLERCARCCARATCRCTRWRNCADLTTPTTSPPFFPPDTASRPGLIVSGIARDDLKDAMYKIVVPTTKEQFPGPKHDGGLGLMNSILTSAHIGKRVLEFRVIPYDQKA